MDKTKRCIKVKVDPFYEEHIKIIAFPSHTGFPVLLIRFVPQKLKSPLKHIFSRMLTTPPLFDTISQTQNPGV